jgi:ketosteroid isomerase-like protein
MTSDPRLLRVQQFYETLTPDSLAAIGEIYADDAWFKDPFNEVRGVAAVRRVFEHMYTQVDTPRFVVRHAVAQGDEAFLVWEFHFRMKRSPQRDETIRGATHILFTRDGRVAHHRDYWDAAEELYEKLPLLGGLMRWIRRRAAS